MFLCHHTYTYKGIFLCTLIYTCKARVLHNLDVKPKARAYVTNEAMIICYLTILCKARLCSLSVTCKALVLWCVCASNKNNNNNYCA